MATLPNERILNRTHIYGVAITRDSTNNSYGETLWQGTTLGNTVTTDDSPEANQADWDTMVTRVDAGADFTPAA